jgi:hypothetical protein
MDSLKLKKILLGFVLLAITVPAAQFMFPFAKDKELKGAVVNVDDAELKLNNWLDDTYQEKKEKFLNDGFGFRSFFVRIHNQLDYSLYHKTNANGIVVGKQNYLYEYNYIKAYYDKDFIGIDSIKAQCVRMKAIQDPLQKLGKQFLLVIAAGKASFYPEYIPDSCKKNINTNTNYQEWVKQAGLAGINIIDGIHWSEYGVTLVCDSLIKCIEKLRRIKMNHLKWGEIEMLDKPKGGDYDIGAGLNLIFRLKSFKLAYPKTFYTHNNTAVKPRLLVIADSFYWSINNTGFTTNAFDSSHFWFYNNDVYPTISKIHIPAHRLTANKEIKKTRHNNDFSYRG